MNSTFHLYEMTAGSPLTDQKCACYTFLWKIFIFEKTGKEKIYNEKNNENTCINPDSYDGTFHDRMLWKNSRDGSGNRSSC